ncbi:hypothetical protein BpHYR1_047040 [Brachionus plicatilis]|uniref:Uncharacterized protein n=1 Tax=Brachionus plicatilis TaxID=10195 RepID=A0A3M7PIA1_BRAPC|nr:hypothetical protein BpHYR1_047040 [Brachionus plicatilis]
MFSAVHGVGAKTKANSFVLEDLNFVFNDQSRPFNAFITFCQSLTLTVMYSMCFMKLNFGSKIIPRSFGYGSRAILWPFRARSIEYSGSYDFLFPAGVKTV